MSLSYQDLACTRPETIAGRFMRLFWHPVFVSGELAAGKAKPIRIMSEDFTLYRGESGTSYLLPFRCAHRGTQLSLGWVEKDEIRCRYHGWKYDGTGQCVEQPVEGKSFASRIKLKSYPVQDYLGLIFAYLGEGKPPAFPRYPRFEQAGLVSAQSRVRRCNYWYDLDNNLDIYHSEWAHRNRHTYEVRVHTAESVPGSLEAWETEWGMTARVRLVDGEARVNHFGMPTMQLFIAPSPGSSKVAESLNWRVPIDDASHLTFGLRIIPPDSEATREWERTREELRSRKTSYIPGEVWAERVLRGEMTLEEMMNQSDVLFSEKVNIQDDVTQIGQGGIAEREREHPGGSDIGVVLSRRIWMRELKALAEGQPLKEWRFSDAIQSSYGNKKEGVS